jgi:serine/threonine protein kinase
MNERANFIAALETDDPTDRAAYLDAACAGDAVLRRRVERLLLAHERADSFLVGPVAALGATVDAVAPAEGPGTRVGPYKLLQRIGEGGMGVVFMAEQEEPVRRKVALKIIKPGMDSAQVIARFEAERQALALMDHPNIARVLDGGTTESGRPYFVMELVHGVPITQFCDDHQLTPRERLALFVPVCQALQHAHQKGAIHRDVKPSNVLVTLYDDKPAPKVIDFGVAKATEQRLTERTLFTQFGALVGTFEYMSPEQAELNALGVDTRSDIYSLGVLLYELLTGTTPLQRERLREAALNEVVRLIKEEEPQRPSARLSSSGGLVRIAAARKTEPGQLAKLVRGELDWITMRCLEKDRTRRYESASALARDIERHLADEPVEAGPPSAAYRLRKFVKRNRGPVTAAGVVLLAVVLGIVGTTWGWVEARWQRDDAIQARNEEAAQRKAARQADADARQAADDKASAETKARIAAEQQAEVEKKRAEEAGRRVQAVQAHLALEKGWTRLERGDVSGGLHRLVRALELAPEDEVDLRQSLRRHLGAWRGEMAVPRPVSLQPWEHSGSVAFAPDGKTFFTVGRRGAHEVLIRRWDAASLKPLTDYVEKG